MGIVFGAATVGLKSEAGPDPLHTAELVAQGVNEILFPVGCALVLFTAQTLGKPSAR
jgi:hypothetical protein